MNTSYILDSCSTYLAGFSNLPLFCSIFATFFLPILLMQLRFVALLRK